ncbi:MAG: ATP-binding protein [Gammaproteobacteria bacterium]|jgi:sigma-B regulation protein RsbU (phosphoserine phosphatase)|nr:ATP-binding protein [Gammaproteobacteria bacterium]NCF81141.1 ATP-binding protein [Pseudomonadota bacterium]
MPGVTVRIENDLSEIPKVDEKLDEFAEQFGLPPAIAATFHIIFDDLLNNVISYGFTDERRHFIDVSLELTANSLIVSIADDGVPFNPLAEATPDTHLSIEDRQIGGLGIHLVINMVDDISYKRTADKNVLTLTKSFQSKK